MHKKRAGARVEWKPAHAGPQTEEPASISCWLILCVTAVTAFVINLSFPFQRASPLPPEGLSVQPLLQ